jgi:hypothetical protein
MELLLLVLLMRPGETSKVIDVHQSPGETISTKWCFPAKPGGASTQLETKEREGRRVLAKLIYSAIASLDGYIEDERGTFEPDDEVHAFVNDLERQVGTYLYGRRLYETMVGWETDPSFAEQSAVMRDFAAIWQSAEKIVFRERSRPCPRPERGSSGSSNRTRFSS